MARCYLGIITPRGLETLVPETEHATPFLLRRAYRRRPTLAVCCWAVLAEPAAVQVRQQLELQQFRDALVTLNDEAVYMGTLLPPAAEDADTRCRPI